MQVDLALESPSESQWGRGFLTLAVLAWTSSRIGTPWEHLRKPKVAIIWRSISTEKTRCWPAKRSGDWKVRMGKISQQWCFDWMGTKAILAACKAPLGTLLAQQVLLRG
jgi:hypothetical protein